ncbi:CAP domain-containing protein [Streptomyces sp. NPDC046915]|uniref:CAP domain-containing protein n=1 Tax=Streptomyces sp. NPDC046915 TaxID=3155257 RepID=UPI0034050A7C
MGKHSKKQYYRRIAVAAAVVGAVGVPSVAMACADWGAGGGDQAHGTATNTAAEWRGNTDRDLQWYRHWRHRWDGATDSAPTASPASKAPTAAPSTARTTAPKHRTGTAPGTPKTTTPSPRATAPAAKTPSAPSIPKPTATASGVAARVIQLVNAERAKVGCSALTSNATLAKAAQAHSADMAAHQNMSHTGSDGSSPGDRITRAGYSWSAYGENVAYGYSTPEQVMAGWMSSPGHRANILNCSFKQIGVGLAQPGSYWTQDFGTPR